MFEQTDPSAQEFSSAQAFISIYGARVHNLQNIEVHIPREQLVVVTGISGSGKSSLAFDTLYAEGQRRYMESFSAYARTFIGTMARPDVDKIDGLSPVISIEQKTTSRNPRSTVGTTTEIYDFLRLLFARAGEAFSYATGAKMVQQSEAQIFGIISEKHEGAQLVLLAPMVSGRKGHYRELFHKIRKMGFNKVRVDGEIVEIVPKMQLDRYKVHNIEIVIDRLVVAQKSYDRLKKSLATALKHGKGVIMALFPERSTDKVQFFSRFLMDPISGIAYDEPSPNMFSFNSPYGMCKRCKGIGYLEEITPESIIPNPALSISQGAITALGDYRDIWIFRKIQQILKKNKLNLSTPVKKIPKPVLNIILYGTREGMSADTQEQEKNYEEAGYEGIISFLHKYQEGNEKIRRWVEEFTSRIPCPDCKGARLNTQSLHFKIDGHNISALAEKDIGSLQMWFADLESRLSPRQNKIAAEILKEIRKRIGFLVDVGLGYLTLNRPVGTLSGGEAQRIRLATQIGSQLVGVLYILDEPSIGLHQRDNLKLIDSLKNLRNLGNSVIVIEHDKDMMLSSDYILDLGPGAGIHGGKVVAQGTPTDFLALQGTTSDYLKGAKEIEVPQKRRAGSGKTIYLRGARGNNLKNVSVAFPLGKIICVTGVSGSGKSTLIHETVYPILSRHFYRAHRKPLAFDAIEGLEHIDKVIEVNQAPIGRTPRSNPATYTGMFTEIRMLFAALPESKIRAYKPGRFSFNVKGGRCESCQGGGKKLIEMDFLPNVYIDCNDCKGRRYNRETLEVRFKGKSIADVLEMTIAQARHFFEHQPKILRKIQALYDVGLGYITLGQHATTLSGGEAQRVKLATELSKKDTGKTFYILDEPTTGLHFEDINMLINILHRLADKGNTVLVIEHNLDVVKVADHILDLGPEGGAKGGQIVAEGTPEQICKQPGSHTATFLKTVLSD